MAEIISTQNGPFLCSSCTKCGNECDSKPDTVVRGCLDYDAKLFVKVASEDKVNHPSHYTQGGIECIDCIRASMPPEGFQDYCKGNVIKYIHRWRFKGGVQDLRKAEVYLKWLIESAEKETGNAGKE